MEHPIRSFAKSISWRVTATITTIVLVFLFSGELALAFKVGVLEVVAKLLIYYTHERLWSKTKFGMRR